MLIEPIQGGLKISTPAKVNLFLDVLGKRADGYHEIDTLMCPVSLLDELTVQRQPTGGVEFSLQAPAVLADDPAWDIPTDDRNLVVRALERIASHREYAGGWRVRLNKRIPAAAGLGGGSSDAAAAIVAGVVLSGRWDRQLAEEIARSLGSDIPLFLGDQRTGIGLARATGRGEVIEIFPARPPLCMVISHPPVGSWTAEVYRQWSAGKTHRADNPMLALCKDVRCPSKPFLECAQATMTNALQAPASGLTDWIGQQLAAFQSAGVSRAMMTGSGSACFAMVENLEQGQIIANKLIELGLPRAYAVTAWYAAPLEQQLERITRMKVND